MAAFSKRPGQYSCELHGAVSVDHRSCDRLGYGPISLVGPSGRRLFPNSDTSAGIVMVRTTEHTCVSPLTGCLGGLCKGPPWSGIE
jgi:hypothetical protein